MRGIIVAGIVAVTNCAGLVVPAAAQQPAATPGQRVGEERSPTRATSLWNLEKKSRLAVGGYDPVAYFPEGGGKPAKGTKSNELEFRGVVYRFANAANKARFEADPPRYEPAYGGWCAWAMLEGEKVEVDPKSFVLEDGRLFLFYDGILADTRAKWRKGDHFAQAAKADTNWKALSGEVPRVSVSLQSQLDAKRAEFDAAASAEVRKIFDDGIQSVAGSGVVSGALKVGDVAPEFELSDSHGATVSLKALRAKGPVIVTWYRGGWCPYCNIQLRAYQKSLDAFKAEGASLVAISPQTLAASLGTKEKAALTFPVLSDDGNGVARRFGIVYTLPGPVGETLEKGVGLSKVNGGTAKELPLAATYVVDTDGKIVYAFVDADYRHRAEPAALLDVLRSLKASTK